MKKSNISNKLLLNILENAPAIIAFHDLQQGIVWANKAYRQALGVSLEELEGQECFLLWGLRNRCRGCPVTKALITGEPAEAELTPANQDEWPEHQGSWLARGVPIRNEAGQIVGAVETAFEITERKRAEQKRLEESEERYRGIFEQAEDGIFLMDREGVVLDCNPAGCFMLGYSSDELLNESFIDHISSESLDEHPFLRDAVPVGEHVRIERDLLCKNGSRRTMEESLVELHTGDFLVMLRDITERKQMELELVKERRLLQAIIDNIPVMITHYDPDSNMMYLNKQFERVVGWTTEEVQYIDMMEQVYPDPAYRSHVWEYMKKATVEWKEFCMQSKTGEPIDSIWSNILLEDGTQMGIGLDIRERKKAEKELQKSEEKYKKLFHTSPEAIAQVDADGVFLTVNQAMAERFHLSSEELKGKRYHDVMPYDLAEDRLQKGKKVIESGKMLYFEDEREGRFLQNYYVPIYYANGEKSFQVISKDVTVTRKMEEKLREKIIYDSLTQVYSRFFFEEEMKRLNDTRHFPVGIIVCDVDGLKLVNDTLGHEKGDYLLKTTASILKECFRSSDVVARIGGDEFSVLLPQSDEKLIHDCCSRIRKKLNKFNREHADLNLSISLGYAVEHNSPMKMNELFKRADDAMYKEKIQQESSSRSAIVQSLVKVMEVRDYISKGHADRLHSYTLKIGIALCLSEEKINDLYLLSRFHDLGKVGVPDKILFKPGPLSEEEFQEMKSHCKIGQRIALRSIDMAPIADLILKHHEWWNGQGYPLGLHGEDIPLECRILAIVDAYDTMTSERPYKDAKSSEEAKCELRNCAGTQFDPDLVEIFIKVLEECPNEGQLHETH